jgi:ADP-heptose:LPS heptosyltransferase
MTVRGGLTGKSLERSMNDILQHSQTIRFEPETIAIVRALPGLGDFLCAVPTLRALRRTFPFSRLTLVGLPQTQTLVERFSHYLTDWIEFPGFPGIPEVAFSAERLQLALAEMHQLHWNGVLQIHGSGSHINGFVKLLRTPWSAGFYPATAPCPDPNWFIPYPDQLPEVCRSLKLLDFLGIPVQGEQLEFPVQPADWSEWQHLATACSLPERYICIHPGASVSDKTWLPQHFATVADQLAAEGWPIVLTGSTREMGLTQTVAQHMRFPVINLAGRTSLGSLAVLFQQSNLLICNDTGVSHLADALRVKSVVIFTGTDPQRWAPLNRQRHRVVDGGGWKFSPPIQVLEAARALLHQECIYV